jgi:hypothetical protein
MKAKSVGQLGLCAMAAAISDAVYNATRVRVQEYPITLDKLLKGLPSVAQNIPGAALQVLGGASHRGAIKQPAAFADPVAAL